jgi:hypothetical protein
MTAKKPRTFSPPSLAQIEANLTNAYGGIIGGARLTRVLGYPTQAAFRQAVARKRVPVPLFTIDGRRGKFANVHDIAVWIHLGAQDSVEPRPAPSLAQVTARRST